jgi:hypothetical protein
MMRVDPRLISPRGSYAHGTRKSKSGSEREGIKAGAVWARDAPEIFLVNHEQATGERRARSCHSSHKDVELVRLPFLFDVILVRRKRHVLLLFLVQGSAGYGLGTGLFGRGRGPASLVSTQNFILYYYYIGCLTHVWSIKYRLKNN